MRILHAPTNVANQAWATAEGLRALGHEVEVWHYGPNPYAFPADRIFAIDGRPERAVAAFHAALEGDFDVYHFHFARSLLPAVGGVPWFWDLPVLRALGKRIFFTFHGSDVRKRSLHLEEDPWSYYRFADIPSDEQRIDKALAVIRTYAQALIVASPLNLTFVPDARYIPKAIELDRYAFVGAKRERRPLVVHVPSRRATKGTDFVLRSFETLSQRGVDFEVKLVENVPHDDLRAIYADADIIVDNLLLGDCEVSSLEAMALGKPVVTRVRDEVRAAHPDVPAVSADPETFVDAITPLLQDAKMRRRVGAQGRAYVEANHASEVVAAKLIPLYEATVRPAWRVFPDWTGMGTDRKLEALEQRLQEHEVKIVDLKRRLAEKDALLRALEAESRPLRLLHGIRRRLRRR